MEFKTVSAADGIRNVNVTDRDGNLMADAEKLSLIGLILADKYKEADRMLIEHAKREGERESLTLPPLNDRERGILNAGGSILGVILSYRDRVGCGLYAAKAKAEAYRDGIKLDK